MFEKKGDRSLAPPFGGGCRAVSMVTRILLPFSRNLSRERTTLLPRAGAVFLFMELAFGGEVRRPFSLGRVVCVCG